ncbi:hypothetical protein Ahy_A01g000098 [Arachis hypogaea]|uniref:Uncharacterized protein n=1 Tax=Arachis hypogaea TaxID=3818 RepID=A0A445EJD1_ARAHY|nr:hypothetical protein Ahy_A01g000098 [Arachis hypogaea]
MASNFASIANGPELMGKTCLHSHAVNTISNLDLLKKRYGTQLLQLLAEDAALKPFKSYKQSVKKLKKIGNILTIVVVAGMEA